MKTITCVLFAVFFLTCTASYSSHKVYLIHGYGGTGIELHKIQKEIERNGYIVEKFNYPSLQQDVDSVGNVLFAKIESDDSDTISLVTHSMGGIVARTLYEHLHLTEGTPFIHRIVMIAPPNQGSPLADYFEQFKLVQFIAGPNIHNLSTDPIKGACKYPIPNCEVGVIIGKVKRKQCLTVPLNGDNDGVVLNKHTTMGTEKDICYVQASHILLIFNNQVKTQVVDFLKYGQFG